MNNSFSRTHRSPLLFTSVIFATSLLSLFGACKKDSTPLNIVDFKIGFVSNSVVAQQPNPIEIDHITGTGSNDTFGKCTFVADASFDVSAPSPLPLTGPQTITTESGDKIFSTMQTYSPDPDAAGNFIVVGSETITGGTGKYANARGSFSLYVSGNISSPVANNVMQGQIIY